MNSLLSGFRTVAFLAVCLSSQLVFQTLSGCPCDTPLTVFEESVSIDGNFARSFSAKAAPDNQGLVPACAIARLPESS
jgi:hypothetical protein